MDHLILKYDEIKPGQISLVGGKGQNIAIAHQAGFKVPEGRIISAEAFRKTLANVELSHDLAAFFVPDIPFNALDEICQKLRSSIAAVAIEDGVQDALFEAYNDLIGQAPIGLIVRSSATVEDTSKASMAGILASFPDIRSFDDLVAAVRKCWASLFTPEAHVYLKEQNILSPDIGIAVLIQIVVPAERSGIIFSMDPVTGDTDKVIVDAIFGFGEEIVSGEVTPERDIYSRKRGAIISRRIGKQTEFITPEGERKPVFTELRMVPKLSDREACELAETGIRLEELFGRPQDIEWAFSNGVFYILQSRPIVVGERNEKLFPQIGEQTVILRGIGVSPAVGSGRVKIISPDGVPEVNPNTVIVAQRITNDLAVHLRRAAAIVTDEGGATSHGANILREFGVPCVLATSNATEKLREDQIVTVDGLRGVVYEGDLAVKVSQITTVPRTKTQVFVSVLIPEKARYVAPFADGVSSLRDDYFMFESGIHPIKMIKQGMGDYLQDNITGGIIQTVKMFGDKPIWYKTMDAPTDEFRRLKGSEDPEERNPLFGWRGIGREIEERDMLELEFTAIKRALKKTDGNIGIKLPFIRFVGELQDAKNIMREIGLRPHEDVKIGISVENPAAVFTLSDFIKEGIDFISVGLSDLVMCTLALDRESQKVAKFFKPNHPAVLQLLDEVMRISKKYGVFACVTGESARYPEVLPHIVSMGFNAIGVTLSFFAEIKREVARIEDEFNKRPRAASF